MKPINRFNYIVYSITTIAVFGIWSCISILIKRYPDWFTVKHSIIGLILAGLVSVAVYRISFLGVAYVIKKCRKIKKLIFSSSYLEGTWIGFYIGVSGNVRYLIETFEQDLDGLIIRGKSFNENFIFHSTWIADSINIDARKGKITYHYKVESPNDISDNNGIAFFNFERVDQDKCPILLRGFSADLHLAKKCKALEYKVSDETYIDDKVAIEKAKKIYEQNKDFFLQ